ncbi:unnamed protein product [Psylliodes chrysocephalus]|uniref:Spaetzle domain-containing protein n=1 Tax=Psylliodes chrysocephalus TaxID=3402493 RepID=A0A9P0GFM7_9CUCU|nr:unnamed protein product [Psylliodes chrysocephala]
MYLKLYFFLLVCTSLWIFVVTMNTKIRPIKKKFIPRQNTLCPPNEPCDKTPGYPLRAITALLKRNKKKIEFLSGTAMQPLNEATFRSPEDPENLCKTRRYSVAPKTAPDIQNNTKFIVNVEGFKQLVTYENCMREKDGSEKACTGYEFWPNDFKTTCRQAHTVIRMLSLTYSGKMDYAYFPIPSGCYCAYTKLNKFDYD